MVVYIKENALLARVAARFLRSDKMAIVVGNTIFLHNTSYPYFLHCYWWVCHELKHVEQYRNNGIILFLLRYITESIKKGYYNNKYEVEARLAEEEISIIYGVNFVKK